MEMRIKELGNSMISQFPTTMAAERSSVLRILALAILSFVLEGAHALWPLPRTISTGPATSFLRLDPSFSISLSPNSSSGPDLSTDAPQDLLDAINRSEGRLWTDKLARLVVGRGESDLPAIRSSPALSNLVLSMTTNSSTLHSISTEAQKSLEDRNEAYNLTIPSGGSAATLSAQTTLGLLRGLTTFEQMWYYATDGSDEETYAFGVPVDIQDEPAFVSLHYLFDGAVLIALFFKPYRGFMLDTARN